MKKYTLLLLLSGALFFSVSAQQGELFTYGGHPVYVDEFKRVFFKNNNPDKVTADSARQYLDLFINFKMKVQQALDMKLDTNPAFIDEMRMYRKQLAQPYMVDKNISEQLIDEAYDHMLMEVNASHILVRTSYESLPKDTLAAFNKITRLRNMIAKGASFETVAKDSSEDESARFNLGSLDYFTSFDMIYPFEKMAYNTPVGQVSQVFRTRFGYHILKVTDKRPNRGKVNVAHIMLKIEPDAKDDAILRGKQKMDSIIATIKEGRATFEEMVKQYSEDLNTQGRNGEIGWVESTNRNFPKDFRDAAFRLKNDGDISDAVKTPYGWHLIKRLGAVGVPPKAEVYNDIKNKIANARDERANVSKQAVISRIKKEYGFSENPANLKDFIIQTDSSILTGTWSSANLKTGMDPKVLFTISNKPYTQMDFAKFVEINQSPMPNSYKEFAVNSLYNSFVDQSLWEFEENNLENKYDQYKYLVQEYHDGILLFNLSQDMVWNKGITDTVGLKEFYEKNKANYMWKERVEASVYECTTEEVRKKVSKWVKKGYHDTTISRMAHEIHPLSLAIKKGKYQPGENKVVDKVKWKKGTYKVDEGGKFDLVVIKQKLPATNKTITEARGPITSDYQKWLEKKWLEDLHKQYPVVVNQATLDNFLSTLNK